MKIAEILSTIQVVLIVLSITGLVDWEWWKVLIPLWTVLVVAVIAGIVMTIEDYG